jgi:hypothetical protein
MQLDDLARETSLHGGRKMARDDFFRCRGGFAEIAAELAAPILEHGRFAPARPALGIRHLDQHIAADRLGESGPVVLAARRQCDVMELDICYGRIRHAGLPWSTESANRTGGNVHRQTGGRK